MKKMKRIAAILVAVTVLVLLPETNASTVHADEPVTYSVNYISDELGWRYLKNSNDFSSSTGSNIYYLTQEIKDGDLVVVYNNIGTTTPLNLGNVHLSNLTFANKQWSMVYAGSVQDCYVLKGTTGTVNCDVKNAYVYDYDPVVFSFNGNVEELTINSLDSVQSNVGCGGTVGHLYVYSTTLDRVFFDYYDFVAGALLFDGGVFKPQGSFTTPEQHAANIATLSANKNTATSSDEYDDVPKTGQSNLYLWLLFASVICFAGSRALKRSTE